MWKDSVWHSIRNLGRPLDYQQTFNASYKFPLNKLPIFNWVNGDASYNANYSWVRGTELSDGSTLGNTITTHRTLNINGTFNMETLYNHIPFLKKANERFKKSTAKTVTKNRKANKPKGMDVRANKLMQPDKATEKNVKALEKEKKELPKNKNTFQKEITLKPDTTITVAHNKKSKRLIVSARTQDGKTYQFLGGEAVDTVERGEIFACELTENDTLIVE